MVESDASILAPLAGFYAAAGRPLPAVHTIGGAAMPRVVAAMLAKLFAYDPLARGYAARWAG